MINLRLPILSIGTQPKKYGRTLSFKIHSSVTSINIYMGMLVASHHWQHEISAARTKLAPLVKVDQADLVFVDNASAGMNAVLRSLQWAAGDIVLIFGSAYHVIPKHRGVAGATVSRACSAGVRRLPHLWRRRLRPAAACSARQPLRNGEAGVHGPHLVLSLNRASSGGMPLTSPYDDGDNDDDDDGGLLIVTSSS